MTNASQQAYDKIVANQQAILTAGASDAARISEESARLCDDLRLMAHLEELADRIVAALEKAQRKGGK